MHEQPALVVLFYISCDPASSSVVLFLFLTTSVYYFIIKKICSMTLINSPVSPPLSHKPVILPLLLPLFPYISELLLIALRFYPFITPFHPYPVSLHGQPFPPAFFVIPILQTLLVFSGSSPLALFLLFLLSPHSLCLRVPSLAVHGLTSVTQ